MSFHVPMKFAHFYDGRSHAFDVDETVTDWLTESSAANNLMSGRKLRGGSGGVCCVVES